MKITNLDRAPYLRLLVYGDSGSGKTTLIGTAMECEDTFPLLVLNARGQPISLRGLDPRPLVLEVESMKDFNLVYAFFESGQDWDTLTRGGKLLRLGVILQKYLESVDRATFGMLAVDSITHVQRLALTEIVGYEGIGPGDVPPQSQIQQWGRVLAQMTNLADKYYQLPVHVVLSALTRRDTIDAMGLTLFAPFLWGQSSMEVPAHAEIVGRLICTAAIPRKDQQVVSQAAKTAKVDLPFNILYLAGGRDFIAKWQGVPNPPSLMPAPTIGKMIKVLAR
jgi:hypothetical protein